MLVNNSSILNAGIISTVLQPHLGNVYKIYDVEELLMTRRGENAYEDLSIWQCVPSEKRRLTQQYCFEVRST